MVAQATQVENAELKGDKMQANALAKSLFGKSFLIAFLGIFDVFGSWCYYKILARY